MMDASEKITKPPVPSIHCMVHLGWDSREHPDFEVSLRKYIDHIARSVGDVLIFVSEGQMCDREQVYQQAYIDMMRNIFYFLSLYNGDGVGDQLFGMAERFPRPREMLIDAIDKKLMKKEVFLWCEKNIDREKMLSLGNERRELLRQSRASGGENTDIHKQHRQLNEDEKTLMCELDIAKLAEQALQDIGYLLGKRARTHRSLRNPERFYRIYQYAQKMLGSERIGEMFIADAEEANMQDRFAERTIPPSDILDTGAATLVDTLVAGLSHREYQKLMQTQPHRVLESLNFALTNETPLIFSGEYREACVQNVARVVRERLGKIGKYIIGNDEVTLSRPPNT